MQRLRKEVAQAEEQKTAMLNDYMTNPDNSSGNESVHEELVNSDSYKKFFGWGDSGERTFKVEELTNKKMRLDYEGTKYVFRKY